jgi:hypothetical protein
MIIQQQALRNHHNERIVEEYNKKRRWNLTWNYNGWEIQIGYEKIIDRISEDRESKRCMDTYSKTHLELREEQSANR